MSGVNPQSKPVEGLSPKSTILLQIMIEYNSMFRHYEGQRAQFCNFFVAVIGVSIALLTFLMGNHRADRHELIIASSFITIVALCSLIIVHKLYVTSQDYVERMRMVRDALDKENENLDLNKMVAEAVSINSKRFPIIS